MCHCFSMWCGPTHALGKIVSLMPLGLKICPRACAGPQHMLKQCLSLKQTLALSNRGWRTTCILD